MEIELTIKQTFVIKTLKVEAKVRYWEDASVDGVEDTNGTLIPCRKGDLWCPLIDIDSGRITNWGQWKVAEIHYKICDEGTYTLLDENGNEVKRIEGYVPGLLAIEDSGYGDYIIINVNEDGLINDWNPDLSE